MKNKTPPEFDSGIFRSNPADDSSKCCTHHAEGVGDDSRQDEMAHRVAALLPHEVIDQNEIIILFIKPSAFSIIAAPLATIISLIILTVIAVGINGTLYSGIQRQTVVWIGAGVILLRMFWQFLEWLTQSYILTDRRIIRVDGIFKTNVHQAPLAKVTDSKINFSLRERLFGLGTVIITVSGVDFIEGCWHMVSNPETVHNKIMQTVQHYRGGK